MKVYATPIAFEHNYQNDTATEVARIDAHKASLRSWLADNGYKGKNSGKIASFGVADGSAQYMLADGKGSFLIHLPYWDAYQYRDVQFLPKKEIVRRLEQQDIFTTKLFAIKG